MEQDVKKVVLKDGRVATLRPEFHSRKLKVKDLISAQRLAKGDKDALPYALVAGFILINGEGITFDDVMEMDFDEFTKVSDLVPQSDFLASGQEK